MPQYSVFIDESGDAGLERIRGRDGGGASAYMTFGGVFVDEDNRAQLIEAITGVNAALGVQELHCNRLSHVQKVYASRELAKANYTGFGLISYKATLRGYADFIEREVRRYYNKCAIYLLEMIGGYMGEKEIPPEELTICFEEGPFDYEALRNFVHTCQRSPIHRNARLLRNIDADNIVAKPKADEPLLQLADLTAHALFKCVDKTQGNYQIPEPRYLNELSQRFNSHPETNIVMDSGIKCIQSVGHLDPDIRTMLRQMKVDR